MDKTLSEADVCYQIIDPALKEAGWTRKQVRREYAITAGRIVVRGKLVARGKSKFADYLLSYKPGLPLAIIEAKKASLPRGSGMQQALSYAEMLNVPFVFTSNGDGFLFHDRTGMSPQPETFLANDALPSPEDLWARYLVWRQLENAPKDGLDAITRPSYFKAGGKSPRYYQQVAINRTLEAIAKGQRRCLLTMATGTGKTYTAFNIIWKLWKSDMVERVLFLADRNILVDQAMLNDFDPFGKSMAKLTRKMVDADSGRVQTAYEIYLALYQAIAGGEGRDAIYDKFTPDFFDLIVIDECHRGSARDDSAWREILEYFEPAIQLGLTATPKETKYVSNIDYFGEPVYRYSLKQGIEDGFLAPFKVVRIDLDIDQGGWTPDEGEKDDLGQSIEERTFNLKDIDRSIVFPERTRIVAEKIAAFLHGTNPMHKTIVFCENIAHAERMRQALMNTPLNRGLVKAEPKYVMRITGDDKEGKAQLENFISPKRDYPVIAVTSKLMTTGVDAQTCHLIVLDRSIGSMTEFKQIVGRGTRLRPDYGKEFFTIMDFRRATELFADPDWDGPPIQIYKPGNDDDVVPPPPPDPPDDSDSPILVDPLLPPGGVGPRDEPPGGGEGGGDDERVVYVVGRQKVAVQRERVQYYGPDGTLITESLRDYTRRAVGDAYTSLDGFLRRWTESERKQAIVEELADHGVLLEAVGDLVGKEYDPFDLICHVAFDQPPLTRKERANQVKKRDVFTKYGEEARAVLEALLDKYADQGIVSIEQMGILKVDPFSDIGTPVEIVRLFGGKRGYKEALGELEQALYKGSA